MYVMQKEARKNVTGKYLHKRKNKSFQFEVIFAYIKENHHMGNSSRIIFLRMACIDF